MAIYLISLLNVSTLTDLMLHLYSSHYLISSSLLVVCPYPDLDPDNRSISQNYGSDNSTDTTTFDRYWNKTITIPFYLIVLLLPLLNFRSASFFARFTFLGKMFFHANDCLFILSHFHTKFWKCKKSSFEYMDLVV